MSLSLHIPEKTLIAERSHFRASARGLADGPRYLGDCAIGLSP
jgi:hypothetical protein